MKPPRGLLVGDRAAQREWKRLVAGFEAEGLAIRWPELLELYCMHWSQARAFQRLAAWHRRRGNRRLARRYDREAGRDLDALAELRDELARTPAERQVLLGLRADQGKP